MPSAEAKERPSAWHDVSNCASFGDRGAEITRVSFTRKGEEHGVEVLEGHEDVVFSMEVVFHQEILDPLYGLLLKDSYGNQILSINSYVYEFPTAARRPGERVIFRFELRFPLLRIGQYTLSAAIAEGTQDTHIEHHWVHDAIVLQVANQGLKHKLGCTIVVENVTLSESSGAAGNAHNAA